MRTLTLSLSLLVACSADPGTPVRHLRTTSLVLPTDAMRQRELALDLDGDPLGKPDNQLGNVFIALADNDVDVQGRMDAALATGVVTQLHEIDATSWRIHPTGGTLPGSIDDGRFVGGPADLVLEVAVAQDAAPLILRLIGARIDARVDDTGCEGVLGGALPESEVHGTLVPAVVAMMNAAIARDPGCPSACAPGTTAALLVTVFDADGDGTISIAEVEEHPIIRSMLRPDLDLVGADGVKDSLSFGVGIGCGVDQGLLPPPAGQGFQLDEGAFAVGPGEEAVHCVRLPLPADLGDGPVFLRTVETELTDPTHHFFMAYREEPVAAPESCASDGHDGGGKMIFLAGSGRYRYQLPDGYALHLPTGLGHMITSHHVLNASDAPLEAKGRFNVWTAPAAEVRHPVNILNCLLQDIWVAPGTEADVTATCTAPFDLDLVVLGSHAHQHLVRFEMRLFDGTSTLPDPIYVSEDWDRPAIVPLQQPLPLRAGEGLTFTCRFANPGDDWIVFGTGEYGEMCAVMSQYAYPVSRPAEVPPSLGTIVYREGDAAPLVETNDLDGPF